MRSTLRETLTQKDLQTRSPQDALGNTLQTKGRRDERRLPVNKGETNRSSANGTLYFEEKTRTTNTHSARGTRHFAHGIYFVRGTRHAEKAHYIAKEKENDSSSSSISMRRSQLPLSRASARSSLSSRSAPQKPASPSAATSSLPSSWSCSRSSSSGPQSPPVSPSNSGHRTDARDSSYKCHGVFFSILRRNGCSAGAAATKKMWKVSCRVRQRQKDGLQRKARPKQIRMGQVGSACVGWALPAANYITSVKSAGSCSGTGETTIQLNYEGPGGLSVPSGRWYRALGREVCSFGHPLNTWYSSKESSWCGMKYQIRTSWFQRNTPGVFGIQTLAA